MGTKEIVCTTCPNGCRVQCVKTSEGYSCSGNRCKRGETYALAEMTHPVRTVTSTVRTVFRDAPVISVRTNGAIPKELMLPAVQALRGVVVAERIGIGDVVLKNVLDTGVDYICTTDRLCGHEGGPAL